MKAFGILTVLLLCQAPAFCWGWAGHRTIALIAQNNLDEETSQKIRDILGSEVTLEQISTCADVIRQSPIDCAGILPLAAQPESADWHLIKIPISEYPTASTLDAFCPNDDCLIGQIKKNIGILKNPSASRLEKQAALMFVVHLAGDLHQPMHCATDGRAKPVTFLQEPPVTLHHLWDNLIETDAEERALDPEVLAKQLGDSAKAPPIPCGSVEEMLTQAALESFSIAKQTIYPAYDASLGQNLGNEYHTRMQPIIFDRLRTAGIRLAYLLEQALADPGHGRCGNRPNDD